MRRVFVDGAAGTVGLALQPHLVQLQSEGLIDLIVLPESMRRIESWRKFAMRQADIVVLCLPDANTVDAVELLAHVNPGARVLDASATHRCRDDWVYGLPELVPAQTIAQARKVANPGCFATACILAGQPLVQAFGLDRLTFQGVTGYTAGGRKATGEDMPRLVQFGKPHRHLPEIARYTGATPVLTTMVGPWRQGMLVQAYVDLAEQDVIAVYRAKYARHPGVRISASSSLGYRVDPQSCNGTNDVAISVAGQPNGGTAVAVVLDNLGKGSAGAAAENLRLMLLAQ